MSTEPAARVEIRERPGGGAVLTLAGPLDVATAAASRRDVSAGLGSRRPASLEARP